MSRVESHETRSWSPLIIWTSVSAFFALSLPALLGRVYTAADLWRHLLPLRWFYANCLRTGDSFSWFPGIMCGHFAHGEGQAGMCHPFHLAIYKFLPFAAAYNLELLINFPIMFAGTYLLLRRRSLRADCALFGALLAAFSAFNIRRIVHINAMDIISHIPWILWLTDVVYREDNRRRRILALFGIFVAIASVVLLGYPQYVWFSAVIAVAYLAFLVVEHPANAKRVPSLVVAVALGLAGGGAQLAPSLDLMKHSVRSTGEWTEESAYAGSIEPKTMLQALSPYILYDSHKKRPYAGAVPLLLFVWTLARYRNLGASRNFVLATAGFAFAMLWLSMGTYGKLYAIQTKLPVVGTFRYPERYLVLYQFALAIVAAFALKDLVELGVSRARVGIMPHLSLFAVAAASLLVTAAGLVQGSEQAVSRPLLCILGSVTMLVGSLLVAGCASGKRYAILLLVPLAALDNCLYGMMFSVRDSTPLLRDFLASTPKPPGEPIARLTGRDDNLLTLLGWRQLDGSCGLPAPKRLDYKKPQSARAAGVRWVLPNDVLPHGFTTKTFHSETLAEHLKSPDGRWFEVPNPMPRAWLVSQTKVSSRPDSDIESIALEETALVDEPMTLGGGPVGYCRVVEERPGLFLIETNAPSRQMLVVSESYYPGWGASVDETESRPVVRVNGDFFGCVVEPGRHRVRFRFVSPSVAKGVWVSYAALGTALVLFLAAYLSGSASHDRVDPEDGASV